MNIEHLIEFTHLAEVGNFMIASDDMNISQSSLSKHIKSLEKELGISLFLRTTRRVNLTEDGSFFLKYAKDMIKSYQCYETEIASRIKKDL